MKNLLLSVFSAALLCISCKKDGEIFYNDADSGAQESCSRIAASASDPYKLQAMQDALDGIAQETPGMKPVRLSPTDYCVRFLPADTTQTDTLLSRGIELFHRPINTMQPVAGEPQLSEEDDTFRWLYSVVPTDFRFPENIEHELLYGVFIRREEALPTRGTASPAGQLPSGLYEEVLARSLQLTGNAPSTRSGAAAQ